MKKLIIVTSLLFINLSGLAFSQSKDPFSKISASILINQVADPRDRLNLGLEAVYNLNKKMSFVLNYFNSASISSDRHSKTYLSQRYFLLSSRINLTEKRIKFFFETGPALTYYTQKVEGISEKYILIPQEFENNRYEVVTYQYTNESSSSLKIGFSIGAGAEVKLSPALSALLKADQLIFSNSKNVLSFSAGLKYNF